MKKILFVLIALSTLHADPGALLSKVVSSDSKAFFIFSDGSFWSVSSFVTRWRTPFEWIAGNELYVPDDYECDVNDWSVGDEYELYYKEGNLRVDETHASNELELKKHSLLMMNLRNGKFFFATEMQPGEYAKEVYDLGYQKGRSDGYNAGYNQGYKNGKAAVLNPQP